MIHPDLSDYLRLFTLYSPKNRLSARQGFVASGDVQLLFRQVVRLISLRSPFNRSLPIPVLLVAYGVKKGRPAIRAHFRHGENRRYFLNDLYHHLELLPGSAKGSPLVGAPPAV